jgi:predicted nuclease with RNAse H fold
MIWFGADPGGEGNFGVAILREDGSFDTAVCSCADEAVAWLKETPSAAGIDAPLWWSSGKHGWRKADCWLRERLKEHHQSPKVVVESNGLVGAVLVQGVMLAVRLRERFPSLPITEAHPGALRRGWPKLVEGLGLELPENEHKRDALLAAVAAREGFLERWHCNLADDRCPLEQDPAKVPHGPIVYWWPDV